MAKATTTKADLAREWANAWEQKVRPNGEKFWKHSAEIGTPLYEACREAHGGHLPNDWIYATCRDACVALSDADPSEWAEIEIEPDTRTGDLCSWLCDDPEAESYADDSGERTIAAMLAGGQAERKREILCVIRAALEAATEE